MKIIIQPGDYTFSAAAKTITFTGYVTIDPENLVLITNVTDGIIIYNFADVFAVGTVAGNVLTLDYDTTLMSDSDFLQIIYDDPGISVDTNALALESTLTLVLTSLQTIDNFISANRGLVTEDNSAAILASLQVIDNFISSNRGLVTEDNSAAIKTAVESLATAVIGGRLMTTELNSGDIKTAIQAVALAIVTEDAVLSANPSGMLQMARKRELLVSENVAEGDAIALNATEKGELLAAISDVAVLLKRGLISITDVAQAIRTTPYPLLNVGVIDFQATIGTVSSITSVSTLSTITTIGLKDSNYVVDKFVGVEAETMFNRILSY
jgi:hypothetical protein